MSVTCACVGCKQQMELPLVKLTIDTRSSIYKLTVEPLRIQRVIADVARDLGYESLTTERADAITSFLRK